MERNTVIREKIKLLIIEDDEQFREILESTLSLEGFEVYLAGDGPRGLKLARRKKPDVILLDWMMESMNGLEVLSKLKYDKKTGDIPVFMMTAKGQIGDIDRACYLGADDYITKPFEVMQLGRIVRFKLDKLQKTQIT
ncbi:MAG: response regulator [Planctomycetes bacterium]|nr:response regulator [Planctomycetota bacterium]